MVDLVFTALVMLLGEVDKDFIFHERDVENWQLILWLHRN